MSDYDHSKFDDIFGPDPQSGDDVSPEAARRASQMKPTRTRRVRVFDTELGWVWEDEIIKDEEDEIIDSDNAPIDATDNVDGDAVDTDDELTRIEAEDAQRAFKQYIESMNRENHD